MRHTLHPRVSGPLALVAALGLSATALAPAHAATPLVCGSHVTADTTLTRDLTCTGTALTVNAGVRLDLGGHTVSGSGTGTAVMVQPTDATSTEIANGRIMGWDAAIAYAPEFDTGDLPQLTVNDVGLRSASVVAESSRVTVTRSTVTDAHLRVWAGELVVSGSRLVRSYATGEMSTLTLRDSTVTGGWWGQDENETVVVERSTLDGTGTTRPPLWCLGTCTVTDSTIRDYSAAAYVAGSGTSKFTRTTFSDNAAGAISGDGGLVVRDSTFRRNGGTAVEIASGSTTVSGSAFVANGRGVTVSGGDGVALRDNVFTRNRGDGVRSSVPGTRLGGNTATRNSGWGLHVPGAVDEGGNVASHNVAGGCLGVVCSRR